MKIDRQTLGFWIVLLGLIILVQVFVSVGVLSPFWETLLKIGAVMSIVSLGLNLIYGFNGQFSLGQWAFYAIGAYAAADVTYRWAQMKNASGLMVLSLVVVLVGVALFLVAKLVSRMRGLDPLSAFALYIVGVLIAAFIGVQLGNLLINPVTQALSALPSNLSMQMVYLLAVLLGGFLAAEVSYLFGLPVLTLGSDYFGIATLGFTIIVKVLLDNSDTLLGFEEMKGARGMVGIPKSTSWIWVAIFFILVIILLRNLLHSSYGRAIISVREDEIAAKAMGIDIAQQKTFAFVFGSFLAGLAGGLYAHINGFLHPNTFNFIKSFDPMIIVVFGGLGSVSGTIIAAFTWALVLEGFLRILLPAGFETWRFVVYPLFLLVMMLLRPQGLFGGFEFPYLRQLLPKPYVPKTQEQISLVHTLENALEGE